MADVNEPNIQPESPQHEGIDPLTTSETMYPRENTKAESERLAEEEAATTDKAAKKSAQTVKDQKASEKVADLEAEKAAADAAAEDSSK